MKPVSRFLLLAVLMLGPVAAHSYATTFDYAYTFGDGLIVSGSFTGVQNGQLIDDIANVSVFYNGAQKDDPIYLAGYDGALYTAAPEVSFDATLNNFVFASSDIANNDTSGDWLFFFDGHADMNEVYAESYNLGYFGSEDYPAVPSSWSLTAESSRPASVPDHGSTLALMVLAFGSMFGFRRLLTGAGEA